MDPMILQQNNVVHVNDFINLIRRENEHPIYNFGSDLLNDCFIDDKQFVSLAGNSIFDQNNSVVNSYDLNSTLSPFSTCFGGKVKGEGEEENDGIYSSSKTITTTTITATIAGQTKAKSRPKTDRFKTLVTERRRRGQMKEKLYALRSLVPNITKMDKASIIGDAVEYVHKLQAQATKLKAEIAGLQTSTLVYESYQGSSSSIDNPLNILVTNNNHPISKMIMQINMYQVEEKGYYGKIACNKVRGVAASLYKALESLAGFKVQNSNLITVCDSLILTFTLNVKGSDQEINLPNLKLWVTGALLNQGFEFMAFAHHDAQLQISMP